MQDAKEIIPQFSGSFGNMLQQARTTHAIMTNEDMAAFTAFSTVFTPAWAATWESDIDAAADTLSDDVIEDQQVQKTAIVNQNMTAARNKWTQIKFFIEEAFPGNAGILNEFGGNDYDRIRRSQTGMQQFLLDLYKVAIKYKTELIAAGYSQPRIDEVSIIAGTLTTKNTDQETFRKGRPKLTAQRVQKLNKVYNTLTRVNAAAQIIFMTDAAKRAQYVFDPEGEHTDVQVYEGTVPPSGTATVVVLTGYDPTRDFEFQNTGTVGLSFSLGNSEGDMSGANPLPLAGGATVMKTMGQLNPGETALTLVVSNANATIAGSYRVEVEE